MGNSGLDGDTLGKAGEVGSVHSEKGFEKCCWDWQGNRGKQNPTTKSFYAYSLALIQTHESRYAPFLMCYSTAKNTPVMCTRGKKKS